MTVFRYVWVLAIVLISAISITATAPFAQSERMSLTISAPKKGMCSVKVRGVVPEKLNYRYFFIAGEFTYRLSGTHRKQAFAEQFMLLQQGKYFRVVQKTITAWVPACKGVGMTIGKIVCKPLDRPEVSCMDDVAIKNEFGSKLQVGKR